MSTQKTFMGKVVSSKMMGMVVVEVETWKTHPKYPKRMRRTKKYHAQAEKKYEVGNQVKIVEVKPISKTKTFMVVEK